MSAATHDLAACLRTLIDTAPGGKNANRKARVAATRTAIAALAEHDREGRLGLPLKLDFDAVFRTVFSNVCDNGFNQLVNDDPEEYIDLHEGDEDAAKDAFRDELDSAIHETLYVLNVPTPKREGGDMEWLGHLHKLVEGHTPNLLKWIEEPAE